MKILESEVAEAKRVKKELVEKLRAYQKNARIRKPTIREIRRESYLLQYVECIEGKWRSKQKPSRENELFRMRDYHIKEILQLIDVGAAFLDDKLTEITRDKLGITYSDVELQNINYGKGSAFLKESSRVLMEMMKGVKRGERPVPIVKKAIALADAWAAANVDLCLLKVCAGVVVDLRCIYDVLKSEIAANQKMEAEVKDAIVTYQRNHDRAQGVGTDVVEKTIIELNNAVVVEQRKEEPIQMFGGSVWKEIGVCAAGAVVGIIAVNALLKKAKKR